MQDSGVRADLEDQFARGGGVVGEGARVVDVSAAGAAIAIAAGGEVGVVGNKRDTGGFHILEPENNLLSPPERVIRNLMGDEALLEAAEVEVAAVAQEVGAVVLIHDVERVAAEQVEELGEDVGGAGGDGRGRDGGRAEEPCALQAGEDLAGRGEEGGEAEGEVVGGVAGGGEDVTRDLEVAVADLDEGFRGEEL